jgi:hypothetical protein
MMMLMIVEKLVKRRLAGETEVVGESLPQRHFVHHKSHMTRPGFEPWSSRLEASVQPLELLRGLAALYSQVYLFLKIPGTHSC